MSDSQSLTSTITGPYGAWPVWRAMRDLADALANAAGVHCGTDMMFYDPDGPSPKAVIEIDCDVVGGDYEGLPADELPDGAISIVEYMEHVIMGAQDVLTRCGLNIDVDCDIEHDPDMEARWTREERARQAMLEKADRAGVDRFLAEGDGE